MCCCGTPTINGQPGYRWQPDDAPSVRAVAPPTLGEFETVLYDLPGRCGGQDSHCYHYQLMGAMTGYCNLVLAYRHGGGEGRIRLSNTRAVRAAFDALDDHGRYWLCNAIYHAHADAERAGRDREATRWRCAAVDKRIKVRTRHGQRRAEIVEAVTLGTVTRIGGDHA